MTTAWWPVVRRLLLLIYTIWEHVSVQHRKGKWYVCVEVPELPGKLQTLLKGKGSKRRRWKRKRWKRKRWKLVPGRRRR